MPMAEVLNVECRETRGKRNARRLRNAGKVPAVLYGHGEQSISLSVPAEELDHAVRRGSRLVNLTGGVQQQAFIRELQWDTWGTHVLHVDFTRISEHEKVQVEVTVELRGEAPGLKEGGVVEQLLHQVQIECEVTAIPEKLEVNINQLNLGESVSMPRGLVAYSQVISATESLPPVRSAASATEGETKHVVSTVNQAVAPIVNNWIIPRLLELRCLFPFIVSPL